MSFYGDSLLSSPDPLAMPIDQSTPSPTKIKQAPTSPRIAKIETSPNKHVQDIYIGTPTTRRNNLPLNSPKSTSPWRIRLTVQAEQVQEDGDVKMSPTRRITEHTTTVTVPLKGGDDTPPATIKKGRGRPRKSLDAPPKKVGTPKPKAGARRKTAPEVLRKDGDAEDLWAPTPVKKSRGRPRKSTDNNVGTPRFERATTPLRMPLADVVEENVISGRTSRTKSRQRRQEITPMKRPFDSDVDGDNSSAILQDDVSPSPRFAVARGRTTGRMKPTATHKLTPRMPKGYVPQSSPESSPIQQQDEAIMRSMVRKNSSSPHPAIGEHSDPEKSDPTNKHEEFDTILESEGFSMISQSSLASTGNRAADTASQDEANTSFKNVLANVSSPSIVISQPEPTLQPEHDTNFRSGDHIPTISACPSLLPAPKEAPHQSPHALEQTTETPELLPVVRRDSASRDALSPQIQTQGQDSPLHQIRTPDALISTSPPVSKSKHSMQNNNNPFSGFGAGTQRELRAGLRLGEELSRRQRQDPDGMSPNPKAVSDMKFQDNDAKYPPLPKLDEMIDTTTESARPDDGIQYPAIDNAQLPSPESTVVETDNDQMSWKADTMKPDETLSDVSKSSLDPNGEHDWLHAPGVRPDAPISDDKVTDREAEWQRERDAVSRQIEMANASQVIVIDSDNEEEEDDEQGQDHTVDDDTSQVKDLEEESDIWQAEASMDRNEEPNMEASESLLKPEAVKPRRSKLPSPWRRSSQIIYSDDVEATEISKEADPSSEPAQVNLSRLRDEASLLPRDKADDSTGALLDRQLNPLNEPTTMAVSPPKIPASGMARAPVRTETTLEVKQSVKRKRVTKLPATPDKTHTQALSELVGSTTSTPFVEKKKIKPTSKPLTNSTAAIDPQLFQKAINQPMEPMDLPTRFTAIQPISTSSTSWFSLFTAPIVNLFTPSAPLPPPATKSDILCSGPHEPLCQLTPWLDTHTRALAPLYYASLLYGSHIFPYNPKSRSARYLGLTVATQPLGWQRKITKMDCGVADAFMVLLDARGYPLGEPGEEWIDESLVVRMCVTIWESMAMHGEVEVNGWQGERVGWRLQRDRLWTKKDIDCSTNGTAYFERKRREFRGLPSWIEMGIEWDSETGTARFPEMKGA